MINRTLTVPGIHCDHCASSIEGAVAALSGVENVRVHIEKRRVDVAYEDSAVSLDAIVMAIEDQGYEVTS